MKYASLIGVVMLCAALVSACETSDATQAVFDNEYPANDTGGAPSATLLTSSRRASFRASSRVRPTTP